MEPHEIVMQAARSGVVLSLRLVTEAHAQVDRGELETAERSRYRAIMWDGTEPCPVGKRERWLHGKDANSRFAQEAFRQGGVVYFVFRDNQLLYWQPFRPTGGTGSHFLVNSPRKKDHWETVAEEHIGSIVTQEVDGKHSSAVIKRALEMHEEQGVPYHATVTER